jgi:hypothetical protein
MSKEQIIDFLKNNIEPTPYFDWAPLYRCSAYLKDGLYIPCVAFQSASNRIDLAIRRFDETRPKLFKPSSPNNSFNYRSIVASFVTKGNSINDYDIDRVETSPFAIPLERLKEIKGETSMSWTGFDVLMIDDKRFTFGTSFNTEFFEMPTGYSANEIKKIIPHSTGQKPVGKVFREKPYFFCYTDGLQSVAG